MKRAIKMNTASKMLAVVAACVIAGTYSVQAQGPEWDGSSWLPRHITNIFTMPSVPPCVNGVGFTNIFSKPQLELEVKGLFPNATFVRLQRFTEANYFNATNGPSAGNKVEILNPLQYALISSNCCFQQDTAGILVDVTTSGVVKKYFGIVHFVGDYPAPVANNDSFTVARNAANIKLDVLTNDLVNLLCFPASTIVIDRLPSHGSAVVIENGTSDYVRYTPTACYCGPDSFTYHVVSGTKQSNIATVSIVVDHANIISPVANPDSYTMFDSATLTVAAPGVLANDVKDTCCDNPVVQWIAPLPAGFNGNANGGFTYKPPVNACAITNVQYKFNCPCVNLTSPPTTVTITVQYTNNSPPVANNDNYSVPQNTSTQNGNELSVTDVARGLLANDTDPDWGSCGNRQSLPITVCANSVRVLTPAGGVLGANLIVNPDGTFWYKPLPNFCEQFRFVYRACDGVYQSPEATVNINVLETNQCPAYNGKPYYTVEATGKWSQITNDATVNCTTFSKSDLLSYVTDEDIVAGNKCGLTNMDWSIGVGEDAPVLGLIVDVNPDDSMTICYSFADLFKFNFDWIEAIESAFTNCGVYCYDGKDLLLTYYVAQVEPPPRKCAEVPVDMNIHFGIADDKWDVPPPAPAIDWPKDPAHLVVEDSVDNLIPTLAILKPAYEANPNNCCTNFVWDIVGGKPKILCSYDAFVEELIVDFWPTNTSFTMDIDGKVRTFTVAGSNVTTAAGGTAKLGGEYIRYTPPANWPLCDSDYDYIPYRITQKDRYLCQKIDVTTTNLSMLGYIKVRVINSCDDTVAQDDHVVVCQDADTPIPLSDLLGNDYDLDFSKTNVVQFMGGTGKAMLGTNAPPAMTGPLGTNGPFTLSPYGATWQASVSNGTVTSTIVGDTCEQDVLGFSASMVKQTAGAGWPWSHGYAGTVWHRAGNSVTLDLPPNTAAFALYLSPSNATGSHQFTLRDNNGATIITNISKSAGAQGVAFYVGLQGDTLESITITAPTAGGFAIGEFSISQQPVGFVHDVGLGMGPAHGQLIVQTNVTDIGVIALQLGYRPATGYKGADSFSYELAVLKTCGGTLVTNFETAMVTVAVGAPVANPDDLKGLIIDQGAPQMNIPAEALLINDTPTGMVQVIGPTNLITIANVGTLMWNAPSNRFEFKPVPGFHGCTNFNYTIGYVKDFINECKSVTNTATSTFKVYVQPVNTPPIASEASISNKVGTTTNFNLFKLLETQKGITNETCAKMHVVLNVHEGRMTYTPDGEVIYTSNPNTTAKSDWFTYYLLDCGVTSSCDLVAAPMTSAVERIDIYLGYVPLPPIVENSTNTTQREVCQVVEVGARDPQVENLGVGGIVAYGLVQQPGNGMVEYLGGNQFRYCPNACYYNTQTNLDSFLWRAQNAAGLWSTGKVSMRVTFVAKTPDAVDDTAVVDRNKSVTNNVLANDIDVCNDGKDSWGLQIVVPPSYGTAVVLTSRQIKYTPNANYCGPDSYTYRVSNSAGSDVGTVSISVNFVNIRPVAQPATDITDEDVPYTGTLQGTDVDDTLTCATTYPMTFSIVKQPTNGTVAMDANTGVFTYVPNAEYYNARTNKLVKPLDTFQFVANDGYTNSTAATVSMQVNWINDWPIANHDTYEVNENGTNAVANTFSVTDNDTDIDSPRTNWTVSIVGGAAYGTFSIANRTNVVYTPNAYYVGHDGFSYRLEDGDGGFDEATVVITVKRAQKPIAYGQVVNTAEDEAVVGQLTGFSSGRLPLVFTRVTQPSNGVVGIRQDGVFEYRPNTNYYNRRPGDDRPLDAFTFQVADSFGTSTSATVTIGVNSVNDVPVANDDVAQVNEGSSNNVIAITANDTDVDSATNKWTLSIVNGPAHGALVPNGLAFAYTPRDCFVGLDSFSYRLNDGDGGSDDATVNITVKRAKLPVAQGQAVTTEEDQAYVGQLVGSNCDGTPLTFLRVTQPSNGTVSVRNDGLFEYRPNTNYYNRRAGDDRPLDAFMFQVRDSFGTSTPATVTIAVNSVNDVPVANDDVAQVNEGSSNNVIAATANDTDVDSATSKWTVSIVNGPANGTLVPNGLTFAYTPRDCFVGLDSFSYRLNDGDGGSDDATVNLTVKRAKLPVAQGQAVTTDEDTAYVGQLVGSNCDGTPLTFLRVTQPSNGTVSVRNDGLFEYRPNTNYYNRRAGDDRPLDAFMFQVTDSFGTSTPATVTIAVNSVNDKPVANDDTVQVNEGSSNNVIAATANDTDVDSATSKWTVSIVNGPANGTLVPNGLTFTYTPRDCFVGLDSFSYRLNDGDDGSDDATVNITVKRAKLPVAQGQTLTTDEDKAYVGYLTGSNCDGQPLTYSIVAQAANGTATILNPTNGQFNYQPNTNYYNRRFGDDRPLDSFTFRVSDSFGASLPATINVAVNAVNDKPVANNQAVNTDQAIPVTITLVGSDVDGDALNYAIVGQPAHGVLQTTNLPMLTYVPNIGFSGTDMFTFRVDDGGLSSDIATVTILVQRSVYVEGDWDGDEMADPAVFINAHPPNGFWKAETAGGTETAVWGAEFMIPVPGDYNGDGLLDLAAFDPATREWLIRTPSGNELKKKFDYPGVIPVPADYDNDGVTDMAVYNPPDGAWYIQASTEGFLSVAFGWASAKPVPADYDGDGRSDYAVYHPSTGKWYIHSSAGDSSYVVDWGFGGVNPVPADYDGDGHADIAIYHAPTGKWYIRGSSFGDYEEAFGWAEAKPVPADYDGDGFADKAVYSARLGKWYIDQSTDGNAELNLGNTNSIPVTSMPGLWTYRP